MLNIGREKKWKKAWIPSRRVFAFCKDVSGGIHGVSTAYYLAQLGVSSLIVEQSSIAAAASGKAGGFLARDWGSGPTIQLHKKSFELHKQLAEELRIESYRQVHTLEVDGNRKGSNVASWLDKKVSSTVMDKNTAQVTPLELTEKMLAAAAATTINGEPGVTVLIDSVIGIARDSQSADAKRVTGVRTAKHGIIDVERVVLCLGPWSGVAVEDWLGLPLPMEGIKSSSIVFNHLAPVIQEPYACFCAEDDRGCHLELYPRPNGELYICGLGGSDHVSGDRLRPGGDCGRAEQVVADPRRVASATAALRDMASMVLADQQPDVAQACMRPCTPDALPVMGAIPGIQGAYLSCGHNCWGILWGPVCGLAMAELIVNGAARTVDLRAFAPERYLQVGGGKRGSGRGRRKGTEEVGEQW